MCVYAEAALNLLPSVWGSLQEKQKKKSLKHQEKKHRFSVANKSCESAHFYVLCMSRNWNASLLVLAFSNFLRLKLEWLVQNGNLYHRDRIATPVPAAAAAAAATEGPSVWE